jgi:zinc transporter 5/7
MPQASNAHFLSVLTASVAFWLPLPWHSPLTSKSSFRFRTTRDHVLLFASIFAFQAFAFRPQPTQLDALVIAPLVLITFALYEPPLEPLKVEHQGVGRHARVQADNQWSYPAPISTSRSWSVIQLLPPAWRPHIQTIVNTPSSSKIFYFLLLNLAYMGVQMAYGVLTNSLGLISDGTLLRSQGETSTDK